MNIKITYNWLREYLDTDADAYELQKYLSLSGPSIERVEKVGNDYTMDIEITSNRIDMASVIGIAREAQAILPKFGKKAKLKEIKFPEPEKVSKELPISITDPDKTANRILGVIMDNVSISESPDYIKERLEHAGIRSLNNIVDVTNYVMLEIGHPTHVFDYDRIPSKKLIFRLAKEGEKIVSLEDKTYTLPGEDVIIDDGEGRIIDLPGIIGTSNSIVVDSTKRILFFIDNNNPVKMRRSSMKLGIRTVAATYNEKAPDPELGYTALLRGIELFKKNTGAKIASNVLDVYPKPQKEKEVKVYFNDIQRVMGVPIDEEKIIDILHRLGFKVKRHEDKELAYPDSVYFKVTVPTYRVDDVHIKEDIIEEIARVYGYYNLPNNIAPMVYVEQPKDIENLFTVQKIIKTYLRDIGVHEVMNYSMISSELIDKLGIDRKLHLKLANTISSEIEYMRISLIPSLIENMKNNYGKREILKFFEISKIYIPRENELPQEEYKLGLSVSTDYFDLKGIIESLFTRLHIEQPLFSKGTFDGFAPNIQAVISDKKTKEIIGVIGKIDYASKQRMELKDDIYVSQLNLPYLVNNYKVVSRYKTPLEYSIVKLDTTISTKSGDTFAQLEYEMYTSSKLLWNIEYLNSYKNNMSLRLYFAHTNKNITEQEAKSELEKILKRLE